MKIHPTRIHNHGPKYLSKNLTFSEFMCRVKSINGHKIIFFKHVFHEEYADEGLAIQEITIRTIFEENTPRSCNKRTPEQ